MGAQERDRTLWSPVLTSSSFRNSSKFFLRSWPEKLKKRAGTQGAMHSSTAPWSAQHHWSSPSAYCPAITPSLGETTKDACTALLPEAYSSHSRRRDPGTLDSSTAPARACTARPQHHQAQGKAPSLPAQLSSCAGPDRAHRATGVADSWLGFVLGPDMERIRLARGTEFGLVSSATE
ncbi:unnamed protein product [Pleuronectes platessa]|uniref:Uncharacterized protein n=1 Tax=Pleuronectes platessa TaxID=8262 RepID=A0A9N7TSN0_PLEPL|nr:unnamed protein product [Pleuronectes platessa]